MNSEGASDLNLKPELPKPSDENMGNALEDIGSGRDFLHRTSTAPIINRWDYKKIKFL